MGLDNGVATAGTHGQRRRVGVPAVDAAAGTLRTLVIPLLIAFLLVAVQGCSAAPAKEDPVPAAAPGKRPWVPPFGHDTVEDSSDHGNHGIVRGEPVRGMPGHQGTGYGFREPGSWIDVPSDPSLNPGERDFVVSAWINFAHAARRDKTFDVVRKGLSFTSTGMYKLELVSAGRARCTAADTQRHKARITSSQTGLADGTWHQIGCARVGSTFGVVVDGVATFEDSTLGTIENDMALSIGSKYGTEDLPDGTVDDVKLIRGRSASNPAPGQSQDERLAQLERGRPVGHWRLDEARWPVATMDSTG